ncbi:MAG: hypothetical protein IPG90_14230 [Bacteroidetes bacterium]|jgi:hypothetical protein|nr:hypothetical protein [Bacteroidota bacterium]MBP6401322.1 hypothetical protein [Bacteroidia bacterium]MBK6839267.1 hypothetical protein [Bacteroidota bacterium]MBK9524326.1 hypothetical protein [Bacteroidota bacterium]MBK9543602.1 hypothetical protein [Bacteroidota bacterium]
MKLFLSILIGVLLLSVSVNADSTKYVFPTKENVQGLEPIYVLHTKEASPLKDFIAPICTLLGVFLGLGFNFWKDKTMRKDDLRQAQAEKLRDCLAEAASLIPELKQYSLEALKGNGCAAYFAVEDKTGMSKEQIEEHERLRQEWIDIDENNSEKFIVAMKSFRKQLELFNSRMVYNETWHKHIQKVNEFKIDIFTLAPVNEVEDEDIVWQKAHDESNNFINTIVEPITMYMSAYIRALEEGEEKEFKDFYLEVVVSLNNPEPQR